MKNHYQESFMKLTFQVHGDLFLFMVRKAKVVCVIYSTHINFIDLSETEYF